MTTPDAYRTRSWRHSYCPHPLRQSLSGFLRPSLLFPAVSSFFPLFLSPMNVISASQSTHVGRPWSSPSKTPDLTKLDMALLGRFCSLFPSFSFRPLSLHLTHPLHPPRSSLLHHLPTVSLSLFSTDSCAFFRSKPVRHVLLPVHTFPSSLLTLYRTTSSCPGRPTGIHFITPLELLPPSSPP